ncbi:MAG: phosphatidylglycerophosphatase A [Rickettsiales bacterium]|jgi:phosphatidylglycerophosphatase A|nr:phosphatidylglycerophosphatase A [Rickettsiales bacterium]
MKIKNKKRFFLKTIVTFFGVGTIKVAPGTFGSLASVPFFIIVVGPMLKRFVAHPFEFFSVLIMIMSTIGYFSSYFYMIDTKNSDDPQEIVIDEVVGQLITYFLSTVFTALIVKYTEIDLVGHRWFLVTVLLILPFLLFRLYDIKKPSLIGYIDRNLKDAAGVMLDDMVAGVFAAITNGLIVSILVRVFY